MERKNWIPRIMGSDFTGLSKKKQREFIKSVDENIPKANEYWSSRVGWNKPLSGVEMIASEIRWEIFMTPFFKEVVDIAALVDRAEKLGFSDEEINGALFPWEKK